MNIPKRNGKIALVGYTLSGGGLERVMATLSVYFHSQGIDVHTIVLTDDVQYPYGGTLVNIGKMKAKHKGVLGKLKLLYYLKTYLKTQQFDYVIDFRYRIKPLQEVIIANWVYPSKTIYTVHSGKISTYIPENKLLANLIFKKKYAVVCVSDAIREKVKATYHFENLFRIYNPVPNQQYGDDFIPGFHYIIGMGRFDNSNVKQLDKLAETYLQSKLPQKNIHLVLLGDGERRKEIEGRFGSSEKIHFLGFQEYPYSFLKKAMFLVLSSKYEGFPMSVIESLAAGTPVVAFDCVSGPNEIIVPNENGLLVKNQDFDDLRAKINLMAADPVLYQNCKHNAKASVEQFAVDTIGQQWLDLMKME